LKPTALFLTLLSVFLLSSTITIAYAQDSVTQAITEKFDWIKQKLSDFWNSDFMNDLLSRISAFWNSLIDNIASFFDRLRGPK